MSKGFIRSGLWVFVFLCGIQAAAFADSVEGRVARADENSLDMVVYDPQGRPYQNQLHLKVDGRTIVRGVRSVEYLRPNDPIGVTARQEESGAWRADDVTLFQQIDAQPASPRKPSPSMGSALGNPVVKGALLGAATGAIASSASGGKAGKGALIGAAAGGILGGLFGGDGSSQDQ